MADDKPGCFKTDAIDEESGKLKYPDLHAAYPGSFTMPHPFLDRHLRKWWDAAYEQREGDVMDYDYAEFEWNAYVALITKYGKWNIDGVPVGDLDGGGMPMIVKVWVTKEASDYVVPFVPPNRWRMLVGNL